MNNDIAVLQLKDIDPNSLSDINSIDIDCDMPIIDRIKSFLAQTTSPYLFRVNGKAVKVVFDKNSKIGFEEGVIGAIKNILASNS